MVPSKSMAPGSVIPSPLHPPVTRECENTHGSHKGMRLTTVSEEVLGLRGTARNTRTSKVICAPDDTVVRSAYIITGEVRVYEICVEHKCGSNPFGYGNTVTGAKGGEGSCFMKVGRTGTLGRFDVHKRYTLGFHLSPIDGFLPVRDIYALWSRQALRQWACNPSSSSSESRECDDEKPESRAHVWFCVGPSSSVCRAIYPARRM
jgi:hypothetical protein